MRKLPNLALMVLVAGLAAGPALAGESRPTPSAATTQPGAAFSPFDLGTPTAAARLDRTLRTPSWLPGDLEVRKGTGLSVSRPLQMGDTDLEFGVAGPVVRKRNLGLAFEVRF